MAIKVKPDKDGRIFINLYGQDVEIDKKEFKDGCATIKRFGETYELKLATPTKKKVARPRKEEAEQESEVDYEELPIKE